MSYERPKLVLAIGSSGGHWAFMEAMNNVKPEFYRHGAIYLAEHVYRNPLEWLMFHARGIRPKNVTEGMALERGGLYFQPGVYQECGKGGDILVLGQNGDGDGLRFARKPPHDYRSGLDYSIISALDDAGYGEDMSDMTLVVLSGHGSDGSKALRRIRELDGKGSYPRILVQKPDSASNPQMPLGMISMAEFLGIPHEVLPPEEIGGEINRFFEESRPQAR